MFIFVSMRSTLNMKDVSRKIPKQVTVLGDREIITYLLLQNAEYFYRNIFYIYIQSPKY